MSHIPDVFYFLFIFILVLGGGGGLNSRCWVRKENTNTNRFLLLRGWVQAYVSRKINDSSLEIGVILGK